MKKSLVIIGGLLLIFVGYFYITQKQNNALTPDVSKKAEDVIDTTTWKTYENIKYGYLFKYSDRMKIESATEEGGPAPISNDSTVVNVKDQDSYVFSVNKTALTSLTENQIKAEYGATNFNDISIKSVQVAGLNAYKVSFAGNVSGVISDFYYLQKPGGAIFKVAVLKNNNSGSAVFSTFKLR